LQTAEGTTQIEIDRQTEVTVGGKKSQISNLKPQDLVAVEVSKRGKATIGRSIQALSMSAVMPTRDEHSDPRLDPIRRQVVKIIGGEASAKRYDETPNELGRLMMYINLYGPYQAKRDESWMVNQAKSDEFVAMRIKTAFDLTVPDEPVEKVWLYLRSVQKRLTPLANQVWPASQLYAYAFGLVQDSHVMPWFYDRIPEQTKARWASLDNFERSQSVQEAMLRFLDDAIATRDTWGETEDQLRTLLGGAYDTLTPQAPGFERGRVVYIKVVFGSEGESRYKQTDARGKRRLLYAAWLLLAGKRCDDAADLPFPGG
jgi:hypothetical protein